MSRFLCLVFALIALNIISSVSYAADDLLPPKEDGPVTDFSKSQLGNKEEVEEKFGTKVDQTILDSGQGLSSQRDRLGNDRAGLFFDHRKDDRLQESSDTIGVQIKLFDLNE